MMAQFVLYNLATGLVLVMLPSVPDNADYLDTGRIIHNGRVIADGIKWDAVGVWESSVGVALDEGMLWRYDAASNEFVSEEMPA